MKKPKFIESDRRAFLKGAAVAGGAAVVTPCLATANDEDLLQLEAEQPSDKGYQENDYIRNYYNRARF